MKKRIALIGRLLKAITLITIIVGLFVPAQMRVFADDQTNTPELEPLPTSESPSTPELTPDPEEITPADVIKIIPEETELVLLGDDGEILSLASEDATIVMVQGDPMYCPVGVSFNDPSCVHTPSINEALRVARDYGTDASGTIYVEHTYIDNNQIVIDENYFTNDIDATVYLSFLGGIDFSTGQVIGNSILNNGLRINNFSNPSGAYHGGLFFQNFIINETGSQNAVTIDNSDRVTFNNVKVNESGDGDAISVQNGSDFFVLADSTVTESGAGSAVQITNSNRPNIRRNVITQTGTGNVLRLMDVNYPTIRGSIISSSISSDAAIYMQNGGNLNLRNNQIDFTNPTGNGTVINLIDIAGSNSITANHLEQFGTLSSGTYFDGLDLDGDAITNILVTDNVFVGAGLDYSYQSDAVAVLRDLGQGYGNIPGTADIQFHDNSFINWYQGFFHNQVGGLTIDATGNYYGMDNYDDIYRHILDIHIYGWAGYGTVNIGSHVVSTDDPDGDGIAIAVDNCPFNANTNQRDSDGDGIGNVCDLDNDGDLVLDVIDNCPASPNADQADNDHDGIGNICDSTPNDMDQDGIDNPPTGSDNCPLVANSNQADLDNDGIGDACDNDNDNDGVLDLIDNCWLISNADQADNDDDGIGNVCDSTPNDMDQDGVDNSPTGTDNCPTVANPDQVDNDNDGLGNACDSTPNDIDQDGVDNQPTGTDNCPSLANPDQADNDNDGVGNACDNTPNDMDQDDIDNPPTGTDNCPLVANTDQLDSDQDGIGNVCDNSPYGVDPEVVYPGGIIPVTGGNTYDFYCDTFTTLLLADGTRITFDGILCGYEALIILEDQDSLATLLQPTQQLLDGLTIQISKDGSLLTELPTGITMTISFRTDTPDKTTCWYWEEAENNNAGGWVLLPGSPVENYYLVESTLPGTFISTKK